MAFEVDYEEDLIPRIRDLIDGYSKDSILKEYLQNADDSEATELIVTFDRRDHGRLDKTEFEDAKGCALLLCNNSKFKEADFKAIVKISAQGKVEDANSTGRFGQGFSSSFSISDHPSFISNGRAYWFDVLKKAVSKGKSKSIQGWKTEDYNQISIWLDTFAPNPMSNDFIGTIFRLPLRTEKTAEESLISHEIFTYKDFLKWCDEYKENSDSLLFLRHVNRLVLQEIDEAGNSFVHVEIKTKNVQEIESIKSKVQDEFTGSLLDICSKWEEQKDDLPIFKYHHHFLIKYLDDGEYKKREEKWAVVNGLFRGENNSLLGQAREVLKISPNPRKVLPWAGVAIQLDEKNKPQKSDKSKIYAFLPLPIKSNYPVHIHGWFDINPKRTEITQDGTGDDKEVLIEWNRLLFEEGVGVAWALLIDFIKEECTLNNYYSLWAKSDENLLDAHLLKGFYSKLSELKCLKTQYKNESKWCKPGGEIFIFQMNSSKELFPAFQEHFSIVTPKPTQYVIDNFENNGIDLKEITSELIRNFLTEESDGIDFPVPAKSISIVMLSEKEWLLKIFEYCAEAEEDENYSYLNDLPLGLTLNNLIYKIKRDCLLDPEPKLTIFKGDESLFLDLDLVDLLKNAETLPIGCLRPNLKNYLSLLHQNIEKYETNRDWIKSLVEHISSANNDEINDALEEIHTLQIVYQSDRKYGYLESSFDSPVFVDEEDIKSYQYLEKTGMKLVHPDYLNIYKPLLEREGLITHLNSNVLIKHLVSLPEGDYSFFKDDSTREYIVDILAKDTSWIDSLSDSDRECLKDIPFIATINDNTYALSQGKNLYLPAGFTPPQHIQSLKGEYEIVSYADNNQFDLFKKLGIKEQTSFNYLKELIIPYIEGIDIDEPIDDLKSILKWLSNEWNTLELDKELKQELTGELKNSSIVLNKSGNRLKLASEFYSPTFFSKLPPFLQNEDFVPVSFDGETTQKKWVELLSLLGAQDAIIPRHIIANVKKNIDSNDREGAINLLNYISNHFEWFEKMEIEGKGIFDYLADFSWMPAEKPSNGFLVPNETYIALQKPSKLILHKDYMIAGGARYFLSKKVKLGKKDDIAEYSINDVAKKIGLLINLPIEIIYESFEQLRTIQTINNEVRSKVVRFSQEFYKYIGRVDITDIPDPVKEKSIFLQGQWLSSSHVFQTSISLSNVFSWRNLIENGSVYLQKGLINLGVKDKPSDGFLIDFLNKLPQEEELNNNQLKDVRAILKLLQQQNLDPFNTIGGIPLLTQDNKLMLSSELYIDDLPAYKNSQERNVNLNLCHEDFKILAKNIDVTSLAENIKPQLDNDRCEFLNSNVLGENQRFDFYICTEAFKSAILRLSFHEGVIKENEIEQGSLDEILPAEIQYLIKLVVTYTLVDGTWIYTDDIATTHDAKDENTLYLLIQDDIEDSCDSISKYICGSPSKLTTDSYALLNRILRNKLDGSDIHQLLDQKNIKALPNKLDISDAFSIYDGDYQEDVETDEFYDEVLNVDYDQTSNFDEDDSTAPTGVEIPPPTQPKASGVKQKTREGVATEDRNRSGHEGVGSSTQSSPNRNTKRISNPNKRLPVYLGKGTEVEGDSKKQQTSKSQETGNQGEEYILSNSNKYLSSSSNKFVKAPQNNEGYDITEVNPNGEVVRFIEVKTPSNQWGEAGVSVTKPQKIFAEKEEDKWWLFVVENISSESPQVYTLKNPITTATNFMFGGSWKQLDTRMGNTHEAIPKEGDKYQLPEGICEVISIDIRGKLFLLKLKPINSEKTLTKKFIPSWKKC